MIRFPKVTAFAGAALMIIPGGPAEAQRTEADALSPLAQLARMRADPGTFWLDDQRDREVVRYTTPRDIRLCLPEPPAHGAARRGHPVRISWDSRHSVILYPGNCMFFDARQVSLRPAEELPPDAVLRGSIETSTAQR